MKFTLLFLIGLAFIGLSFKSIENSVSTSSVTSFGSSGIKFDKMTLSKAIKKAKSTGKLIFIDVYTTWCGPCKEMAATTFQDSEVGNLFNNKFINLKIDAENDADGPTISRVYTISGYPTLLFINGEGKLVKKLVGKQSKEKLLAAVAAMK
ncbi:thioredoxin family protein [Fluviicola taffensis]|uniref:Thioredoxin domain-containing protein n=1 Tax=Fluviicola taffensis (strain DSM 16823 / NCIMB 13979 / RW262) TaxID=755732 RepID=F2IBM6_FLUTR|nr:thioredoxin domain-containing protein [Fluviicola taffensis]AEA45352.1 Thioredoxin domain-containing protein [Fluviicola taffensis DSM 16823]